MDNFLNLAMTRRSIRKFENKEVSQEDIDYIIEAACSAPSGCNSQCWNFIVIKDRSIIDNIGLAVQKKAEFILNNKKHSIPENYWESKKKMLSFFTKAPLVIAVFMTNAPFYDSVFISALEDNGYNDKNIMDLYANYDVLSIGAAIQNLLLAAHEKGYGACWMNEPAIASEEIKQILEIPSDQKFMSIIPVGYPAYTPKEKFIKSFDEVCKII